VRALAVRTVDQTTRQQKSVAIGAVMPIAQRSNTFHEIDVVTRFSCSAAPQCGATTVMRGVQAWDSLPL
jgi:hypothetical protein